MLKNKIGAAALCVFILLVVLFLFFHSFDSTHVTLVEDDSPSTTPSFETARAVQQPSTQPNAPSTPTISAVPQEEVRDVAEETSTDSTEVKKAIDFLETLEEHSQLENGAQPEDDTGDSSTDLTQDELFELVREGVSYYDSLLESGSVDFYIQTSTADFPFEGPEGLQRLPHGTSEGTFEFSYQKFRGAVTENRTQYDENGKTMVFQGFEQFAYDGETFETYKEGHNGPLLTRDDTTSYDTSIDPRIWGWSLTSERSLTDILNLYDIQQIEVVSGDTGDLYHLRGTYTDRMNVELWLDPQKSYRPERYSTSIPIDESKRIDTVTEFQYQEVAPDLWFPKTAGYTVTAADMENNVETNVIHQAVRFTNLRINERIPSSRFKFETSPGTIIYDSRTRETFTVE